MIVAGFELTLLFAGVVLCWRLAFSPAARARRLPPALAPWNITLSDFLLFVFCAFAGMLLGSGAAYIGAKLLELPAFEFKIIAGSGGQVGLLAGAALGLAQLRGPGGSQPWPRLQIVASGVATFLISLPVLTVTSLAWRKVLRLAGLPEDRQELVDMFARVDSPWALGVLVILAIAIAPLAEEFVFRAGLFRYLRTRVSRWLALVAPGVIFASLHMNLASFAPLVVLAVIFSLAYERTGRIETPMVAHALFNLNTIMLLFSGVPDLA